MAWPVVWARNVVCSYPSPRHALLERYVFNVDAHLSSQSSLTVRHS